MMKRFFVVCCASLLTSIAASADVVDMYPSRPVRVLVGLAPGGGSDTVARIISQKLSDTLGQSFVVENRPAAGGMIAGELVARATPDGHTLILVTPTHVVNPSFYKDTRYDVLRDFAPVVRVVDAQYFLSVSNATPAASLRELIALAKSRPQALSYASSGLGGPNHLAAELFKTMAGINLVHVPYKGGAPAMNAILAGEVEVSFTSSAAVVHAKAGRMKTLASTGIKRAAFAPHVPTIAEAGVPGYEVVGWYGIAAPAKTPRAIIETLNAAVNKGLPELKDTYEKIGMDVAGGPSAEFATFVKSEKEKWARVVKQSGAKLE